MLFASQYNLFVYIYYALAERQQRGVGDVVPAVAGVASVAGVAGRARPLLLQAAAAGRAARQPLAARSWYYCFLSSVQVFI